MIASLVSVFTGIPVSPEVAMTGEITLSGTVMPVGGIKEKVLAAKSAGITTVVLPRENMKDIQEIPADIRSSLAFKPVSTIAQAIKILFPDGSAYQHRVKASRVQRKAAAAKRKSRPKRHLGGPNAPLDG